MSWIAEAAQHFGWQPTWDYLIAVGFLAAWVLALALIALGAGLEHLRG